MANNKELSQFANVVGYNGGNIGINDNDPDTRLSVNSGATNVVAKFTSTDQNAWIQFRDNSTTDTAVMVGADGDNLLLRSGSNERLRITSAGRMLLGTTTVPTGLVLGNSMTAASSTGAEVVAFRSDTSVAVGDKCGAFVIGNSDTDGVEDHFVGMWGKVASTNGSMNLHFAAGRSSYEGDTPDVTIKSGGNIGIGTDNPRRHLHLCGGNETTKIQITNATTGSANDGDGFQLSIATDGAAGIEQRENLDLFIATNNTERARFTNNGKFLKGHSTSRNIYGIHSNFQIEGTDFQSSSLSITCNSTSETPILLLARSKGTSLGSNTALTDGQTIGEISFVPSDGTDMGSASVRLQGVADDNHGSNDVPGRFIIQVVADGSESSSERFRLGHDGRMRVTGVYQETTGGSANVNVQSDGLLQRSISSIKYKKDVETLEDSYADALLELRPVWYRSKCASDNPNHGHWGFVAEELAEIDPRLVIYKNTEISWDENGFAVETSCDPEPEGVQYDRFVPHLLNLIKRQKTRIETLETQCADLLARVTVLEGS